MNEQERPEPIQPEEQPQEILPPELQSVRPLNNTNTLVTWGFISAALGFFGFCCCCCPSLFGLIAVILGAIAYSRGDRRGLWVIIAGVVALFGGFGLSVASGPYVRQWAPDIQRNIPGPWRGI